ncbi:serine/threonine-protein kinase [Actinophytocola oryzae]|uniref:non-specific serine/threonine protein kinase n=1 Tax=Actinophytocola oryzae TaxID=502181 RepID=A0A4R7UTU0_9PSEU|nr:serine/threonine-protein kinase [Actinophytocola oryzae]TDV40088.1 serine/threonine protein kinase [Actinophytocola oryzae]
MHDITDDQFPSQPELSDKLPRFRLIRKLSETKMSVIYLAEEKDLGNRPVVVKVIAPMLAEEDSFRERFRHEILRTANLGHHNIVPVYSAHTDGELLYLVMPYIEGPNLRDLLRGGPIDLPRTVHMIREVASALDFAHAAGIVHRDVKPSNILIHQPTGRVMLCDFGIAAPALGERLTEVGRQVGTPGYLAPELIPGSDRGHAPVDPRADVYSLGVVLYQCLTGRPPHQHSDVGALLWAQGHEDPRPVSEAQPGLPRALDKVLATALAKRPQDRYRTCTELADELTLAVTGGRVRGVRRTRPHRALPWKPVVAIAAAVAVVATVVVVLVTNTGADDAESPIFRVPPVLRGDCDSTGPSPDITGAGETLLCHDGDQLVRFSLFADQATMDSAYSIETEKSGVARDNGDCTKATGAEHRYPNGGDQVGRVLCYTDGGTTRLVWTNDRDRTIAETEVREADDRRLAQSWTGWVGIPAYPTDGEKSLVDLVELARCGRAEAGTLSSFRDLVAGIDCDPTQQGANAVSYYRFGNVDAMRRTYDQHVRAVNAPSGSLCIDSPLPANFLGNRAYDLRSVDLGTMLCYLDERGQAVLEWTVEPLLVMVRATGPKPEDLVDWFEQTYGIPLPKVVDAANKKSRPPFPTVAESALLGHIPEDARKNCMRPPASQIKVNRAGASTAAVVCGPTPGATIVFYYQFPDKASMDAAYLGQQDVSGRDCLQNPPDFHADAPYSRGGDTGRLSCASVRSNPGNLQLFWTSDRTNILVMAFQGWEAADMLSWWQSTGGPA